MKIQTNQTRYESIRNTARKYSTMAILAGALAFPSYALAQTNLEAEARSNVVARQDEVYTNAISEYCPYQPAESNLYSVESIGSNTLYESPMETTNSVASKSLEKVVTNKDTKKTHRGHYGFPLLWLYWLFFMRNSRGNRR